VLSVLLLNRNNMYHTYCLLSIINPPHKFRKFVFNHPVISNTHRSITLACQFIQNLFSLFYGQFGIDCSHRRSYYPVLPSGEL